MNKTNIINAKLYSLTTSKQNELGIRRYEIRFIKNCYHFFEKLSTPLKVSVNFGFEQFNVELRKTGGRSPFYYFTQKFFNAQGIRHYLPKIADTLGISLRDTLLFEYEDANFTYISNPPNNNIENQVLKDLESLNYESKYFEGGQQQRFTSYYERNPKLRAAAIKIHGLKCKACCFNFEDVYGNIGKNFIEIHHLKPVSELNSKVKINPYKDLVPVCSNCHRMIHRSKENVLSIETLKKMLKRDKTS